MWTEFFIRVLQENPIQFRYNNDKIIQVEWKNMYASIIECDYSILKLKPLNNFNYFQDQKRDGL